MNCYAEKPQNIESESTYQLGLIFAIGWASTDQTLLPLLPETIGALLQADRVQLLVTRWDDVPLHNHIYQSANASETISHSDKPTHRLERSLGRFLTFSISIHTNFVSEDAAQSAPCFECIFDLLHTALESLFVTQGERSSLGPPFTTLADREWQVCQALEGSDTEKMIAHQLGWSSHTLHSYVKGIYRKIGVQSRLEVVSKLKQARLKTRREAFNDLARHEEQSAA